VPSPRVAAASSDAAAPLAAGAAAPDGEARAGAGSLDALFGAARVRGSDEAAAEMFAGLYTAAGELPAAREETAAADGARRVAPAPSLDEMFRPAAVEIGAARPTPKFSFDQFFAGEAGAGPAGTAPHAGGDADEQKEIDGEARDIAQFNAWLEGLKKT
jgi:hypothetical protein